MSGTDRAAAWWNVAQDVFSLLGLVCWVASLAGQALSYRRSSGERRQQLKWLMTGSAVAFAGMGVSFFGSGGTTIADVFALAGFLALPLSIVWGSITRSRSARSV